MTRAFTLIELLVVITIIVVLLAMLAPALDKAIYQAELTVCGTRQRSIVFGAKLYAADSRRAYPFRPQSLTWGKPANAIFGKSDGTDGRSVWDDRIYMKGYIDLAWLNDPLTVKLDFATDNSDIIWIPYNLWFGFQYKMPGETGAMKLGDRFTYKNRSFNVLVSDYDLVQLGALSKSATPDYADKTRLDWGQDRPVGGTSIGGVTTVNASKQTWAWWSGSGSSRALIDVNNCFDDGAVVRRNGVRWNEWQDGENWAQVPDYVTDYAFPTRYVQIPAR